MKKAIQKLMNLLGIKRRYTTQQKKEILLWNLSKAYSDYDKQTGNVDLHPVIRAKNTIKSMEEQGKVYYYFDLLQLNRQHQQDVENLNKRYCRVS